MDYHARRQATVRPHALAMVQKWIDGFEIRCIGGTVYGFKHGAEDHGRPIMNNHDAVVARDLLSGLGIRMLRIDSGGSPQWEFKLSNQPASA